MDWLLDFLGTAGGAAFVAGLFGMWQWFRNRKASKEDSAAKNKKANCTLREQEINALRSMCEGLQTALRAILYDRIKRIAKTYIARGWVTFEEWEDLKMLHGVYHDILKGNGFLDEVMESVSKLEKRAK